MKRFEYQVTVSPGDQMLDHMNNFGGEGWELCFTAQIQSSIQQTPGKPPLVMWSFIWKRERMES